jgi:hypothetical protein
VLINTLVAIAKPKIKVMAVHKGQEYYHSICVNELLRYKDYNLLNEGRIPKSPPVSLKAQGFGEILHHST